MVSIKQLAGSVIGASLLAGQIAIGQTLDVAEPFKLGTFSINGAPTVGLVLRDELIVDIAAADAALDLATGRAIPAGIDMLSLIEGYESGLKQRLYALVNELVADDSLDAAARPAFIHAAAATDFLPPILYPSKVMNAAVNFYTHACEGCSETELAAMTRERQQNRGVPYLFLKPTRGAIIGNGDDIVIPYGRDRTDWEVELGTVIGRQGKYVAAARAEDYVFGYMVTIDISDRGGRPPGGAIRGTDWFVGKGHDTFAPQGPWIVPKEFYGDPMQRLHQQLTIDGITVQEAKAGDMIHSLWELIEYASSLITLYPGDVLNSGTSGGTSMGAFETGSRSGYLEPGEEIAASIEGIGTLRHTVIAGERPPSDLSGAELPPVDSYEAGN